LGTPIRFSFARNGERTDIPIDLAAEESLRSKYHNYIDIALK